MSDEQQPQQLFEVQRIYLKDASFESPSAPTIFTKQYQPETNLDLNTANRKLADNLYEVDLRVTLTVKSAGEVAYLVEIKYAGIFGAKGYSEEQLGHLLGSYCPHVVYPYAREAVSDLVVKGGFPQMLLAPINFDALYMQKLQEKQAKAAEGEGEKAADDNSAEENVQH